MKAGSCDFLGTGSPDFNAETDTIRRVDVQIPGRHEPTKVAYTPVVVAISLLSISLSLLRMTTLDSFDTLFLLSIGVVLLSSFCLASLCRHKVPRPGQLVFWFTIYMSYGVVPALQASLGVFPVLFTDQRMLVQAQMLVILGIGFFLLGLQAARASSERSQAGGVPRSIGPSGLSWFAIVSLFAAFVFIFSVGGPGVFFSSRDRLNEGFIENGVQVGESEAVKAVIGSIGSVPVLVCLLVLLRAWSVGERRIDLLGNPLVVLLIVVANLVVNNPISGRDSGPLPS